MPNLYAVSGYELFLKGGRKLLVNDSEAFSFLKVFLKKSHEFNAYLRAFNVFHSFKTWPDIIRNNNRKRPLS